VLLEHLAEWRRHGYLNPIAMRSLEDALRARRDACLDRLAGHPTPTDPPTNADRLDAITAVLDLLGNLRAANAFATPDAELHLRPPLLKEQERLEIALGRRKPEKATEAADERMSGSADRRIGESAVETPAPAAPKPPPTPLMERFWRTLLSERTLNALLFWASSSSLPPPSPSSSGAGELLRAAAGGDSHRLHGVVLRPRLGRPHQDAAVQLRHRHERDWRAAHPRRFLHALQELPHFPDVAPEFWLMTSLVCLGAYLGVTWIIQNRLFGYLVGFASVGVVWFVGELLHKFAGCPTIGRGPAQVC
jgi:hypothetical protein